MLTNTEALDIVSKLITDINNDKSATAYEKAIAIAPLLTKHAQLSKIPIKAGHLHSRLHKENQAMPKNLGTTLKMPVLK